MQTGRTVLAQLMDFVPKHEFDKCVRRYGGDKRVRTYVLVALARKRLGLSSSLYTILQILSVTLFEKTPILQALSLAPCTDSQPAPDNQLCLQGF